MGSLLCWRTLTSSRSVTCYHDPVSSYVHVWCRFDQELYNAKGIHVGTAPRVEMGVSFETKKKRQAAHNPWLPSVNNKRAPRVVLGSVEAWAQFRLTTGEQNNLTRPLAHQRDRITCRQARLKQYHCCADFDKSSSNVFGAQEDVVFFFTNWPSTVALASFSPCCVETPQGDQFISTQPAEPWKAVRSKDDSASSCQK